MVEVIGSEGREDHADDMVVPPREPQVAEGPGRVHRCLVLFRSGPSCRPRSAASKGLNVLITKH